MTTTVQRVLLGLALLVFAGYLLVYVNYAGALFAFPFDYDQGEGFELYDTLLFSRGEWPYRNNETYPFYASNYPPLFHVLIAPLVRLFGPQYWTGRLLGFIGTLINAALIGLAVYRAVPPPAAKGAGTREITAVLSGLAFLASNTIYHIGPLFRQHMFMVMLETLAVVLLANFERPDRPARRRELALVIAVLLAAGYTKQLAVMTAAAVFGFLFLRGPLRAVGWGLVFAALGLLIFGWIDLSTGGQWSLNAVAANVNLYIPGQARDLYIQWFKLHGPLIVMAGLLLLYEAYFDRISVYGVWFVAGVAGGLLSGKWGAGDSYFATAIAATCVMSGVFAARTLTGGWRFEANYLTRWAQKIFYRRGAEPSDKKRYPFASAVRILVPIMYLAYALAVRHISTEGPFWGAVSDLLGMPANTRYAFHDSAGWVMGYATIGHSPTAADIEAGHRIAAYYDKTDKPILSEEAGFALMAGAQVVTNPTQLKNLWENGLYDPTSLVEMIDAQEFGYVIFRAQFYPQPILDAVARAYITVEVIEMNGFEYIILAPKEDGGT
ncbi:MAG: hypothetical protein JXB47_15635 [Anaerolineae bacterium]|nr:hypothetical protein [Anaerolineae bacterium]